MEMGLRAEPVAAGAFVSVWERVWNDPRVIWCLALVPHVVAVGLSCRSVLRGHGTGNLADFVGAAREMLRGGDIYAGGTGGYVYPPLIAFLYQPLAAMPTGVAAVVSLGVNAVLSVLTLFLVARVFVWRLVGRVDPLLVARVALFGAVFTADKIKGEFSHIETNVFMLLAFTAAMRWVDRRPWLCGMALGFAFNIKYLPVVLVPYLLLRGRWRAVGWFAAWAVAFALVPAISMGWEANARAWVRASAGLANLFGVDVGVGDTARLRSVTDMVSLSLTSGVARVTGLPASQAVLVAGVIGLMFAAYAVALYVRAGVPLLAWPSVRGQGREPFRGLLTTEWMGVLLLTLIFSPFTNSRHLYMLLDVNIAAGVLLLGTGGRVPRGPLAAGAIVMAMGVSLPPGGGRAFSVLHDFWRGIGGPAWCMLVMYAALIWTNVRYQVAAPKWTTRDARLPSDG